MDLRPRAWRAPEHARGERPHVRQPRSGELCMTTSLTDLFARYDVPVPRYTSYPTVPEWHAQPTTDEWIASLDAALASPDATLSVYVHLPFCESLCTFCGCNTVITKDHGRSRPYIDLVLGELDAYLARVPALGTRPVYELHF